MPTTGTPTTRASVALTEPNILDGPFVWDPKDPVGSWRETNRLRALSAQKRRDFANGTPLYDADGNESGRRVTSSITGETDNLGITGRELPPWQQW